MIKSKVTINDKIGRVSSILTLPERTEAILLLAHGAGAGMEHPFMEMLAEGLHDRQIGTLRFNFPYMEQGKAPRSPKEAITTIQKLYEQLISTYDVPIFIGGKSYGGRMASHASSEGLVDNIHGLIYFGFPLHPPGKPGISRAEHLSMIKHPMLFLQGVKDKLAEIELIRQVTGRLPNASIVEYGDADHSFKVPKRSSQSQEDVFKHLVKESALWMKRV